MLLLIRYIIKVINFFIFCIVNRTTGISKVALLWQENLRYRRYFETNNIKLQFSKDEKLFICSMYKTRSNLHKYLSLVKPETVLYKWKKEVKKYWTHTQAHKTKGHPPISEAIKEIIKNMKIYNYLWGCIRIKDELTKVDIDVSRETIRKVINDYRKDGKIKPNLSWNKFLKSHWKSLFACDFFTVDLLGFKRLYVFFILKLENRKIVHFNITSNPTIQFLRHQISHFEELYPESYLIHDNSGELKYFPYDEYYIKGVATAPYSPNMNAFAERFIRSIRRECLDWFIIFNEKQLRNILKEYISYYNKYRPHQGLGSIPDEDYQEENIQGKIIRKPVLFGLHNHYYRKAC